LERLRNYDLRRFHLGFDSVDSSGLAFAYFGFLGNGTPHVRADNVSFGGPRDKLYYNTTQYIAWSVVSGIMQWVTLSVAGTEG